MDILIYFDGVSTSIINVPDVITGMNLFFVMKGLTKTEETKKKVESVYIFDHDHPDDKILVEDWDK